MHFLNCLCRKDTVVDFSMDPYTFGLPKFEIVIPGTGENVKYKYFQLLLQIQSYLEKFKADDTDAFVAVIRVSCCYFNVTDFRKYAFYG